LAKTSLIRLFAIQFRLIMAASENKDIVIVGGGIIGSTTAYYLTRHPKYDPNLHSIHLIEGTKIAAGASGKAGGLLALWAYPSCLVPLSFKLHEELAKEHGGAERWGYRRVSCGELSARGRVVKAKPSGIGGMKGTDEETVGLHSTGGKVEENVSLQKRTPESLKNLKRAGLPEDLDWFADECVQAYDAMGTPENTAQVHPYQFTTSMADLAQEKGVKIVIGIVTEIKSSSSGHSVSYTPNDPSNPQIINATDVVLTAGPWTKDLLDEAPIGALRAHSVTIRPSRPTSAYAIFTSISLPKDFREGTKSRAQHVTPEIYARPNDELYACGEGDHMVPLPKTAADVQVDEKRCQDIVDYVSSVSDELRDGEVLTKQACYLPQVEGGGGPLVGPTNRKRLWLAAGHTCWGIQNGPGTGKVMSEFVMDGEAKSARVGSLDPRRVL
jgi:glycine/D-amino acid oxidase-like deaminating enzyme